MLTTLHSLEGWDTSSPSQKQDIVRLVDNGLVPRVRFEAFETHSLGGQEHTIAIFGGHGARFALLPGYTGPLGYESAIHLHPLTQAVNVQRTLMHL